MIRMIDLLSGRLHRRGVVNYTLVLPSVFVVGLIMLYCFIVVGENTQVVVLVYSRSPFYEPKSCVLITFYGAFKWGHF